LRGAEDVAAVIKSSLEKWKKLPREKRLRPGALDPKGASQRRERRSYPEDGLVLELFSRDLPEWKTGADVHEHPWNQDHVWFTRSEAATLVPEKPEVGARATADALGKRLAMLHFIDVTHGLRFGEPPIYEPEDELAANIQSTVESVDGPRVKLRLEGTTHARSKRAPASRGVDTQLLGQATWDREQKRFVDFELVALGTRWGANWLGDRNDRADEQGPQPIGYALSLAGTTPHDRVPPEYLDWYDR
jgi:hypothetical protein